MPSEILEENDLPQRQPSIRQAAPSLPTRQDSPSIPNQESPIVRQEAPALPDLPNRREAPSIPVRPEIPNSLPTRHEETYQEERRQASPALPTRPLVAQDEQKMSSSTVKPSYISQKTGYVPRKLNFQSQNDICTGCKKTVYAAELVLGAGNKYHKVCLKCCECGKRLDSTNMVDRDFDLYCRGCYSKSFGPKGYGYGNLLSTEGATR